MSDNKAKGGKSVSAWEQFSGRLTGPALAAMIGRDDVFAPPPEATSEGGEAYRAFASRLTGPARAAMEADAAPPPARPEPSAVRYCLFEYLDGEHAVVRTFKEPEGMARRIGALEGEDVGVWACYGVIMTITRGPQRYLMLPGGKSAMMIPLYDGGPVRVVDADLLDSIEPQDDGYLGPPEMSPAPPPQEGAKSKTGKASFDPDED